MSVSYIPEKVKIRLWGKAAGRCQYEGCNKPLWRDSLTKAEFNTAYIAHIIADRPDGPRGDQKLSKELKSDISNLLLMCDEHHRLIDIEDERRHPVRRLKNMKQKHEKRIEILTSFTEEKQSHVLLYGANIGQHQVSLSLAKAVEAMMPQWYPAEGFPLQIGISNSLFRDHEGSFWTLERENLRRQFAQVVRPKLSAGNILSFCIFALAPQPLLIELGRLLSDIPEAYVYQLHREPPNWKWQEHPGEFHYIVREPESFNEPVALNLSLSATIDDARITSLLGNNASIWTLTINNSNNDFLKSKEQLSLFRQNFRKMLDYIKTKNGQHARLHIFPAVPESIAVEIGRVWMPKADLPLRIYDQNPRTKGFSMAFDIATV